MDRLDFYYDHPVEFAQDLIFGFTQEEIEENRLGCRLEPETVKILDLVARNDYVTVHAGRGVTKTTSLALLIIWFIWTRKNAKAMVTGPKFDQLKSTIWNEVRKWLNFKGFLLDDLEWTSEKLEWKDGRVGSFSKLLTAKDKENIAGIHDEHVFWLIDEASNVDEIMIDAILGGMTDPESKIIMAGNPTKASGAFYNSFTKDKDLWTVLRLNAEDCQRQNKMWMKKMQRFPRESDTYRVWVLGLPPRGNPKAIMSLEDVQRAVDRTVEGKGHIEIGLDPASEGNDLTCIAVRWGKKVVEIKTYAKSKAHETVQQTLDRVRYWRTKTKYAGIVKIKVDDSGYGQAIRQLLALNTTDNVEVVPCIFFGGKQKGDEIYANYGTIMWYSLRDLIDEIELPQDQDMIEELSTREWAQSGGKISIEQKTHYKERLGRSPDRADAVVLCFAGGPKKVLVSEKTTTVDDFEVDWADVQAFNRAFQGCLMVDIMHIAALVVTPELEFCALCAVYEFIKDKLWIYDEYHQETPVPEKISPVLKFKTHYGVLKPENNVKIIGSEQMFKKDRTRRPLAEVLRREKLRLRPPTRYDEFGAIALGVQMFKNEQITLHKKCVLAREEVNLWSIKGKVESQGFCEALLLILSEVRNQKKERPSEPKMKDYTRIEEKIVEKKTMNRWAAR